jgi:uncharacterized protein
MSSGLLALLDDVVALAKVAAASLDDIAAQAAKAGTKAAGIVVDDTAVTPRYVVGFAADRELPIIGKIAWGSIKNKILFLLPAALLLSTFAPWAITPLLMFGGAFLCFEGYEKIHHIVMGHDEGHDASAAASDAQPTSGKDFEDEKVAGAIKTDFILSAEIMAISLASITAPDLFTQALVLAAVALIVTGGVYGLVALIVKADDFGLYLAQRGGPITKAIGQGLVKGMPPFLNVLSFIGTLAMLWVGGGIIVHGLNQMGYGAIEHVIHDAAVAAGGAMPVFGGAVEWLAAAVGSAIVGIVIGGITAVLWTLILGPVWRAIWPKASAH